MQNKVPKYFNPFKIGPEEAKTLRNKLINEVHPDITKEDTNRKTAEINDEYKDYCSIIQYWEYIKAGFKYIYGNQNQSKNIVADVQAIGDVGTGFIRELKDLFNVTGTKIIEVKKEFNKSKRTIKPRKAKAK